MSRPDCQLPFVACTVAALLACDPPAPPAVPPTPAPEAASSAPPSVATLLGTSGDVRVRRAGEVAWTSMGAGEPLFAGDAVQTMSDGRAILRFAVDGAQSELEEATTLVIPAPTTEGARLTQLSGRLVARVEPGAGAERLEVLVPAGVLVLDTARLASARVTAIEARVDVTEERTDIAVTSGRVSFVREREPELSIDEGRFATLDPAGDLIGSGFSGAISLVEPADGTTLRTRGRVSFGYATDGFISDPTVEVNRTDGAHFVIPGGHGEAITELDAGEYTWTVVGRRDGELARSGEVRTLSVVIDVEPPMLALASPGEGATVRADEVTIRGSTETDARVEVDGITVPVDADGGFRTTRSLPRGLTNLVIRARDALGNSRVISRSVVRP